MVDIIITRSPCSDRGHITGNIVDGETKLQKVVNIILRGMTFVIHEDRICSAIAVRFHKDL